MKRRRIKLKPGAPEFEKDLERRLKDIEDLLDSVTESFVLGSVLVQGLELDDGVARLIPHGLGREWIGWKISNLEGAVTPGVIQHVPGEDTTKFLRIQADGYGATVTVSVEVF